LDFKIHKKTRETNESKYSKEVLNYTYEFSKRLHKEAGDLVKGIVLFGSAARRKQNSNDIDILLILDDTKFVLTSELVEAYRIITEKIIYEVSPRLHITTLKYTTFWEYVRNGDPIAVNILRDGVPIVDHGFFDPLQHLLRQGRIRPSMESIWTYHERAPKALRNSKAHLLQATLDLYWAVMDSAHAALMYHNVIPPSPTHVPELVKQHFGNRLTKRNIDIVEKMYNFSKMIVNQSITEVKGKEFDRLMEDCEDFVKEARKLIK
jgi:predicted nucleotidyltransferase